MHLKMKPLRIALSTQQLAFFFFWSHGFSSQISFANVILILGSLGVGQIFAETKILQDV